MSKEEALQQIAQLREKVSELQQILYAEHRQSLLIVFQAMDTGGKDGTIRKLLSGINPAGIRVTPFKVPSRQERDHDFLWRTQRRRRPKDDWRLESLALRRRARRARPQAGRKEVFGNRDSIKSIALRNTRQQRHDYREVHAPYLQG